MQDYLSIRQASQYLHVSIPTLRRWEKEGKIKPYRTEGNHRRYTQAMLDSALSGKKFENDEVKQLVVGYCRVSSHHQKADLKRQQEVVQTYCENLGIPFKIISDEGSGLNYDRKGFKELIHLICNKECSQVVVNYPDRLVRFGFDLVKDICAENNVDLTVINQTPNASPDEELVQDVLSVITVFSAKLYGKRSHKNEKIVNTNKEFFTKNG